MVVEPTAGLSLPGGPAKTADEAGAHRRAQAAIVRSEIVLHAALADPTVGKLDAVRGAADPAAWLGGKLTVGFVSDTVLRVQVRAAAPADAAALANAVARAYVARAVEIDAIRGRERVNRLEGSRGRMSERVRHGRTKLQVLAAHLGVPADPADRRALLAALYAERAAVRAEARQAGEGERAKAVRAALAALDDQIRRCESGQAELDELRAEVERLAAADAALAGEVLRAQLELDVPPRASLLQEAVAPPAGPN